MNSAEAHTLSFSLCVAVPVSVCVVQSRPRCIKTHTVLQLKNSQRPRWLQGLYVFFMQNSTSGYMGKKFLEELGKIFDAETCIRVHTWTNI